MCKNYLKRFIPIMVITILVILPFCTKNLINVKAKTVLSTGDYLITVGSGDKEITVTTDTTIDEIKEVLGKPKIKTISAFGGYAYTFYTDDNYSNYLYIETTDNNKIISYGSVDKNYKVYGKHNRGENYTGENPEELEGHFYTDDENKIIGGVYYNLNGQDATSIIRNYNVNYDKYSEEYLYGITKHAVPMFNALSRTLGKQIDLVFDEESYNVISWAAYPYASCVLKDEMLKVKGFSSNSNELGAETNVLFSDMASYVLNPMHFAELIKGNLDKNYTNKNIAMFNYDKKTKELYGYTVSTKIISDLQTLNENDFYVYHSNGLRDDSVLFATNLLDDNMTEHEKALVLAQYLQEGDTSVFWNNYTELAGIAGLACEYIYNNVTNKGWIMCNLDNEWTYLDINKESSPSFDPAPYQKIKFNMIFESRDALESKNLSSNYDFSGLKFAGTEYPNGKSSEVEEYNSRIYYDENYKYYEKTENKQTKIYKENRKTGEKENLVNALYSEDGTGLVKENDNLYYIGTDGAIYIYDLTSKSTSKVLSISDTNKQITGVFLDKKGYISYVEFNKNTLKSEVKTIKKIDSWPKKAMSISDDNSQKYKFSYIESQNNISIIQALPFGYEDMVSEVNIPDEINGKPVIGIGYGAFYNNQGSVKVLGNLKLPKDLLYINYHAFRDSDQITNIEFNSKLKSIGTSSFEFLSNLKGKVSIPDSVTYIGPSAFYGTRGIKELELSKNLKYLPTYVFTISNLEKLKIPEGIEYLVDYSLCETGANAIFLPESLIAFSDLSLGYAEELFIHSKKLEQMAQWPGNNIYLPDNTQTSVCAKKKGITYRDITDLTQTIKFNNTEYIMDIGFSYTFYLGHEIYPKYYFDDVTYEWINSNPEVAKVTEEGMVTPLKTGTTTISLTSNHGGKATAKLTVTGLMINYTNYQLNNINEKLKLSVTHTGGWDADVTWSSSSDEVATVDQNGLVTPKRGGFVTITATSDYYGSVNCLVYISVPIEMSDGSKVYAGDLNKDGIIDKKDLEIIKAYISNGNLTTDQVLLSDINGDGIVDEKDIEKMEMIIINKSFEVGEYKPITNVILDKDQISLAIGKTSRLNATITPNDTTDSKELTWKSSNNTVATVDNEGNITAKANGTVTITVTTSNGKSATCKVVVGTGKLDYIKGDINRDEVVDVKDAREVLYMAVGMRNITDEDLLIGDMNANKKMESGDAIEILRIYLKKE